MLRPALFSLWSLLLVIACSDGTFEHIPKLEISSSLSPGAIFRDSIVIGQGLFFRQLSERDYQEIYGHAHLKFPAGQVVKPAYELVVLSCRHQGEEYKLLCSIDPDYHAIIDVMTYQPSAHQLISLEKSRLGPGFTDIKLLEISRMTPRPDTLLIQVSSEGILEKIALCCDF